MSFDQKYPLAKGSVKLFNGRNKSNASSIASVKLWTYSLSVIIITDPSYEQVYHIENTVSLSFRSLNTFHYYYNEVQSNGTHVVKVL